MKKKRSPKHIRKQCKLLNMKIINVGVFFKKYAFCEKPQRKKSYDITIQVINLSGSEILLSLCSYKIRYFSSLLCTILIFFLLADDLKKTCPWEC